MKGKNDSLTCQICGKGKSKTRLVAAAMVSSPVVESIRREHPEWVTDGYICIEDLNRFRNRYIQTMLEAEKGELTSLEHEVLDSLARQDTLSSNTTEQFERVLTFGERLADRIADIGGSWGFILGFACFLLIWVAINSAVLLWRPFDPYPFILLNLILSCIAAIQAPIIMMSQNRQAERDRLRAVQDYEVNLKAELEIMSLHEKLEALRDKEIAEIKGQIAALGRVG